MSIRATFHSGAWGTQFLISRGVEGNVSFDILVAVRRGPSPAYLHGVAEEYGLQCWTRHLYESSTLYLVFSVDLLKDPLNCMSSAVSPIWA